MPQQGDDFTLTKAGADVICTATSAAGGAATATTAAINVNQFWLITGYDITADGAPAAAIAGGIQQNAVIFYPIRLSANAFAPIAVNFVRPLAKGAPSPVLGLTVGITMAAIGGAVVQTVSLRGVLVTVS